MDYKVLAAELALPAYAKMSNAQAAAALNAASVSVARTFITGAELWECTLLAEYAALAQAARDAYQVLVSLGSIDVSEGSNSRMALAVLFGAGTQTRANLLALAGKGTMQSRAAQLGLPFVGEHHVATAREATWQTKS